MKSFFMGGLLGPGSGRGGAARAVVWGIAALLGFVAEVRGAPNLVPQDVILSTYSARPGNVITVAFTMRNTGTANAPASFTGIRMGTSATAPPSSDPLNLTFTTTEIPAGGAVRQTNFVTIPTTVPLRTYFIWVIADPNGFINQTSRLDDAARSAALAVENVPRQPNLVPVNITLGASLVRPGDSLTVAWTMTNSGPVTCPASFTGLHLGTSATVPPVNDPVNLRIATPEIGPNSSLRMSNVVTIPAGTALGTYYLWVVADDVPNSTLNQSSRADDAARSPALSVVNVIPRPNLVMQNVTLSSFSARRGDVISVIWTVANTGTGDCPASVTGVHLGTSATAPPATDALDVTFPTPEIPAGGSVRQTNTVTIPANIALGTYYVWVIADDVPNSTLNQTSKTDDAARSEALTIATVVTRPNLMPQNVLLSAYSTRPGDQISVMWTTTNSGNGNCPASLTGLHLGSSTAGPPSNDAMNVRIATPPIAAHSAVRQTNVVTIPANTPNGNYYIWVVVDDVPQSTLDQTSRADDAARSAVLAVLTVARQPNLAPQNVLLNTDFARPGDPVTVRWTMRNLGNVTVPTSLTGLRLGTSPTVRPTNETLNVRIETPEIGANSSLLQTNTVTLPAETAPGTYYLWVIADDVPNSTLNQSSRTDDGAASGPLLVASELPRPNLAPLNVTLSVGTIQPGGQVSVAWTMTNSGTANCPASTTGLHLGAFSNSPPANDHLNLKIPTPAINANSSLRQTNVVTIPANTPAGTYYLWVVADDVPNSPLDQSSKADDAAPSGPLAVVTPTEATLISPAHGETVSAPPTFSWSAPASLNAKVYLANKSSAIPGVDTIVFFDNPAGTNSFRPSTTNWFSAVNTLGLATNYYWTVGSPNATQREIFAEWRPFKTIPMAIGGLILPASGGDFQFQVIAPNQQQVVIQRTETLINNWTDAATLQNPTGTVTYTDETAGSRSKSFYRAKP